MIEILPNWHPIFVHFTVALFSVSAALFLLSLFVKRGPFKAQVISVATWNLWIGGAFTLVTLLMGWFAYNSVGHDAASHAQMTTHKNWAFVAAGIFGLVIVWSLLLKIKKAQPGFLFVVLILGAGGVLAVAAYHGGEAVFKYGLGVKCLPDINGTGKVNCLPKAKGKGHSHTHAPGQGHGDEKQKSNDGHNHGGKTETKVKSTGDGRAHSHGEAKPINTNSETSPANGGDSHFGSGDGHSH